MIIELNKRIDEDYHKGIIAIWHDESHINKYIYEKGNYRLLSPAYCYPEGWELPFEKRILVLDKKKYLELDEKKIKEQNKKENIFVRGSRKIVNVIFYNRKS